MLISSRVACSLTLSFGAYDRDLFNYMPPTLPVEGPTLELADNTDDSDHHAGLKAHPSDQIAEDLPSQCRGCVANDPEDSIKSLEQLAEARSSRDRATPWFKTHLKNSDHERQSRRI